MAAIDGGRCVDLELVLHMLTDPEACRGSFIPVVTRCAISLWSLLRPLESLILGTAEAAAASTNAALRRATFVSSNLPTLAERRVLCPSWRLPPPHPAEGVPKNVVPTVHQDVQASPSARAQRFL